MDCSCDDYAGRGGAILTDFLPPQSLVASAQLLMLSTFALFNVGKCQLVSSPDLHPRPP